MFEVADTKPKSSSSACRNLVGVLGALILAGNTLMVLVQSFASDPEQPTFYPLQDLVDVFDKE